MKLATWNVNSLAVRLPQVLDWLAANPVDALVLQETNNSHTRKGVCGFGDFMPSMVGFLRGGMVDRGSERGAT